MPCSSHGRRRLATGVTVLLLALPPAAPAHETHSVKDYRLTIGWGEEPAYSGYRNSIEVDVADGAGQPVVDLGGGSLSVEVSFGDERMVRPLLPSGQKAGRFRAGIVPTRPGTYTFHVTGTIKGQTIEARSTCSERTFDCVIDASELQFPARDPSVGELAESVRRAIPRTDRALDAATSAQRGAMVAIALAAAALALVIALRARRGKQGA